MYKTPVIRLEIKQLSTPDEKKKMWERFKKHHYLSADLNISAHCFVGYWEQVPISFMAVLAYPSGTVKNAMRASRLVVLPDFQGIGVGIRMSETVAQFYTNAGKRFFAKTANKKLGEYRNRSQNWRPTSKNEKARADVFHSTRSSYNNITDKRLAMRVCYSHEFLGMSH